MNIETEAKIRKVYREFKRNNKAQSDIEHLTPILNRLLGKADYSVNSAQITTCMMPLDGYCLVYKNYNIFFPKNSVECLEDKNLLFFGEMLNYAETILPPYVSMGTLGPIIHQIKDSESKENQIELGNKFLEVVFGKLNLSTFSIELYPKFKALKESHIQIKETIELYSLGYYRSAITTLLPCIENAIRSLGNSLGISEPENVGAKFLLGIIEASVKKYINDFVYHNYDWVPAGIKTKSFFNKFDKRVQIMLNCHNYVQNHLYQSTAFYSGLTQLNRHSIIHGFMPNYYEKANFLRLINLLNGICFMLTMSGEKVSLLPPLQSDKSIMFFEILKILSVTGGNREKAMDKFEIER
ncbi:hypothetical protein PRCB_02240 [Pantoea rodasii]|uniref:Uncharacterized protein n=1 Tax=Pantoea rodasii TaxID=1076549 RepID=A0A2M9WJ20_9GAMM|nr:hypothetical protein [Pantoea rodasii]ORM64349.1 hypothetical protein HA45_11110 [Pantoea rodasii]PJZ07499.1 hypothetical protein PRCB_02240 [Pantoea rodasii]